MHLTEVGSLVQSIYQKCGIKHSLTLNCKLASTYTRVGVGAETS